MSQTFLGIVLAQRLNQIFDVYPDYNQFVKSSGISRGTLHTLRTGHSNPSFETIERLAKSLGMHVFELLGISEEFCQSSFEQYGLDYKKLLEISKNINLANEPLNEVLHSSAHT